MSAHFLDTGMAELDQLLGLPDKEFPDTATILIRGGQGAGKTTLALQILNHQLKETIDQETGKKTEENEKNFGLFLSLERQANVALKNAKDNLGMTSLELVATATCEGGKVLGVDGNSFRDKLKEKLSTPRDLDIESFLTDLLSMFKPIHIVDPQPIKDRINEAIKAYKKNKTDVFFNVLAETIYDFVGGKGDASQTLWLVVDSLNVLERAIFQRTELEKYRGAIQGLANALHGKLGMKIVVLFTGEYHTPDHDVSGASGESFFCDVEILLTQEPVIGKARTDPRNSAAAGFNIELHHDPKNYPGGPDADVAQKQQVVVETRPFCRVLKSRFGKHQSRRCSYKIEKDIGFQFDDIFPGDGHVLLFEDNTKQREDWEIFLLKDGPHEFPALRFELFDRSSQQRIFSTERSFRGHRRDTDLHLASLDTYWINWFRELNERFIIGRELGSLREEIKKHVEQQKLSEKEAVKRFANALCRVHWEFLELKKSVEDKKEEKKQALVSKICTKLNRQLKKITKLSDYKAVEDLKNCWEEFQKCNGMLIPLKWDKLRLYGEDCSDLLPELASLTYIDKTKTVKTDGNNGQKVRELLSVPFNANVSFLVRRKESPGKNPGEEKQLVKVKPEVGDQKPRAEKLMALLEEERKAMKQFFRDCWPILPKRGKRQTGVKPPTMDALWGDIEKDLFGQLGQEGEPGAKVNTEAKAEAERRACTMLAKRSCDGHPPLTWEEIIVQCEEVKGSKFIIETRSFDTLLCTFLEFAWGCGANLTVDAEYQVNLDELTVIRLYQAVFLLQRMLQRGIITKDSTVEPSVFGPRYSVGKEEWTFMRHWHSTLVDVLVSKKPGDDGQPYWWNPDPNTQLEIMPLPQSFWQLHRDHLFKKEDFRDIQELIRRLIDDKDDNTKIASEYLRLKLEELRWSLPDLKNLPKDYQETFTNVFNKLLEKDFYVTAKFKNVKIPGEDRLLLRWMSRYRNSIQPKDRIRLNRWLLEDTYPQLIKRSRGVSCWGEWHLAMLHGSENTTLAAELVNNLMSSSKISSRALRGAALPAVADFYRVYENSPCVLLQERSGEVQLPKMTYGELRNCVFSCAQSRSQIFDYRHCMHEFHGFLVDLIHNPEMNQTEVGKKLVDVLRRIGKLRDRELLLH